jgi:hypothetical protein
VPSVRIEVPVSAIAALIPILIAILFSLYDLARTHAFCKDYKPAIDRSLAQTKYLMGRVEVLEERVDELLYEKIGRKERETNDRQAQNS